MHDTPIAVITGSTKGIGRGIASSLSNNGYHVIITSRDQARAEAVAEAIISEGGTASGLCFDLDQLDSVNALIETIHERFGRLDVLVNNALSTNCVPPFQVLSDEQIIGAFTSNISHQFLLCKKAQPLLQACGGNIINIGSVVVNRPILGMALYTIIKGAIVQMTKALAAEWAGENIRVNAINPGFVYSSAMEDLGMPQEAIDAGYKHCEQFHPLGRIGEPADVGELVAFIASSKASLMTGSIIDLDAGMHTQGISIFPPAA